MREIRDEVLERRILDFIKNRLDDVRQNRTGHELRLAKMLPGLDQEFGETHSADDDTAPAPTQSSPVSTTHPFAHSHQPSPTGRPANAPSAMTGAQTSSAPDGERSETRAGTYLGHGYPEP